MRRHMITLGIMQPDSCCQLPSSELQTLEFSNSQTRQLSFSMSPFHLKESPLPQGEHYAVIRKHPKTCYVCYNLHSESAYSIYPKQRLRMNPNFLVESANKAAGREGLGDSFSYEGANRIKYLSWAFEAYLVELRDSAAQGCITCLLLMEALIKLTKEDIDFNDASLFIIVVFFRSTVLRIRLVRGDELEEDEFDFVPWEESEVKEILGHYELYTLHGKSQFPYSS